MTPEQHTFHTTPLVALVATKLHLGTTLAERVKVMRYRRRKAPVAPIIETPLGWDTSLSPTTHET